MNSSKQLKLDIISKLSTKKISIDNARLALGVSERTILRYLSLFLKTGPLFVNHGNEGRSPKNKNSVEDLEKASVLMKDKYFDFNITHALEKLSKDEGLKINRETFRKNVMKREWLKWPINAECGSAERASASPKKGIMLQMDGSPHRWFGGKESCLIGAIDDATSEVHGAKL